MNQKSNPENLFSKRVALVYPEKLSENPEDQVKKKDLIPFYDYFIPILLDCQETEAAEEDIVYIRPKQ